MKRILTLLMIFVLAASNFTAVSANEATPAFAQAVDVLGPEMAHDFFETRAMDAVRAIFGTEEVLRQLYESRMFYILLQVHIAAMGPDMFMEVMGFDFDAAIALLVEDGLWEHGLGILDDFLLGLLSENRPRLEAWHSQMPGEPAFNTFWPARQSMHQEAIHLRPEYLEIRFCFGAITNSVVTVAYLGNEDPRRTIRGEQAIYWSRWRAHGFNLFYENNLDHRIYLRIFGFRQDLPHFPMLYDKTIEVAARDSFVMQMQLDAGIDIVEIFIVNPYGEEQDGILAFRWTEHPLGHPSHRAE